MQTVTYLKLISFDWELSQIRLEYQTDVYENIEGGYIKIFKTTKSTTALYKGDDYSDQPEDVQQIITKYWELKNG